MAHRPKFNFKASRRARNPNVPQQKRFYWDKKGKVYNLTPSEAFTRFTLNNKHIEELNEEDYTPAMKVLYGTKKG